MKEMNISREDIEFSENSSEKSQSNSVSKDIPIIVQSQSGTHKTAKIPQAFSNFVEDLSEQEAILLGAKSKVLKEKIPINELFDSILETKAIETVIFDGIITQRLLDIASEQGIKNIVGAKQHDVTKRPLKIDIYTFSE
jgi:DNA primase